MVVGARGGDGGEGMGCFSRLYSRGAHICSVYQTLERTQAASLIHLPTQATQMSPQLICGAADETLQPLATLNLIPLWVCVKSQWGSRESNRLNMMWSLLSGDYKVSISHSHRGRQKYVLIYPPKKSSTLFLCICTLMLIILFTTCGVTRQEQILKTDRARQRITSERRHHLPACGGGGHGCRDTHLHVHVAKM